MLWHKLYLSARRWIFHSGESLRAWRCEWRQLAHSSHPLLQQGEFTSQFARPFQSLISLLISDIFTLLMSVWWVISWSVFSCDGFAFYLFELLVHLQKCFSAVMPAKHFELIWDVCACIPLCGCLLVTILFMHIRRTSPLIFFIFFHFPQPATRYVSMSVCQSAHTVHLPLSFSFCLLLSSFSIQQTVREEWVCCLSTPPTPPLFSYPCACYCLSY